MTGDEFAAVNMVAQLRSRGIRFTPAGPEIPEHLTGVARQSVPRQIDGLAEMISGPEAWAAVAGLDTDFLENLWGRLGEDGPFRDGFVERFDGIFQEWAQGI